MGSFLLFWGAFLVFGVVSIVLGRFYIFWGPFSCFLGGRGGAGRGGGPCALGPGARMLWGPGARGPYALGPGARVLWGPGPVNLTGSMEQAQLCKHPACCSTCTSDTAPPTLHCTSDTALPTALHLRHCSSKSLQSAWNPATIPQAIPRSHSTTVRQRHSKSIYIGERAEQRHEFFYYFNLGVFFIVWGFFLL